MRTKPYAVGCNETGKILKEFETRGDAEDYITLLELDDPIGVLSGDYYIDGPEGCEEI